MPDWWEEFLRYLVLVMSLLLSQIPVPPWLNPQPPAVPTSPPVPGVVQPASTPYAYSPVIVPTAAPGSHVADMDTSAVARPTIAVADTRAGSLPVVDMPPSLGSRAVTGGSTDRIVNPSGLPHWPGGQRPPSRRGSVGISGNAAATTPPPANTVPVAPIAVTSGGVLASGIAFVLHRLRAAARRRAG